MGFFLDSPAQAVDTWDMKDLFARYFPLTDLTYTNDKGITQYAEIAARFHAAILGSDFVEKSNPSWAAQRAFDHADAFFAELEKRQSNP